MSGRTVRLTLGQPVAPGRPVTLSYFKDGTAARHRLKDANGNEVANIDDEPVTNADGAGTAPRLAQATVEGNTVEGSTLTLVFDQALDESSAPEGDRFAASGVAGKGEIRARVRGETVVVTLADTLPDDAKTVWVRYVKGNDTKPLRGANGGPEVEDFRNWQAAVLDGSGPDAVAGSVSGTEVTLHFDEVLDPDSAPPTTAFAVTVAGAARTVNAVEVKGTTVSLTLASAAAVGETVTVTYANPPSNWLKDPAGNEADGFSLSFEGTAKPTVGPMLEAADPAVADENRTLTLTFDQPLHPQHVPGIEYFTLSPTRYQGVSTVTVRGRKVVLLLNGRLWPCDGDPDGEKKVTVGYAVPGIEVEAQRLRNIWDTTATATVAAFAEPVVVRYENGAKCVPAEFDGERGSIILRAGRPFATDAPPRTEWFTVAASGGPVTVTRAAFSEDDPHELVLSLSRDPRRRRDGDGELHAPDRCARAVERRRQPARGRRGCAGDRKDGCRGRGGGAGLGPGRGRHLRGGRRHPGAAHLRRAGDRGHRRRHAAAEARPRLRGRGRAVGGVRGRHGHERADLRLHGGLRRRLGGGRLGGGGHAGGERGHAALGVGHRRGARPCGGGGEHGPQGGRGGARVRLGDSGRDGADGRVRRGAGRGLGARGERLHGDGGAGRGRGAQRRGGRARGASRTRP